MVLNIRSLNNLAFQIFLAFVFPLLVNAHDEGQSHSAVEQAGIKHNGSHYDLAVINQAPDFVLVDLKGERVSLKELQGKIKIINFIYTSCPDACPIVTERLSRLQEALRKEKLLGGRVEIISISIDPTRDTEKQLKRYADRFKANRDSWLFLRGTQEQTKKILSDYDIWLKKLDDGTIDHVMRVYLVDGKDRIREIYNLAFLQPELVVRDIEMILTEK